MVIIVVTEIDVNPFIYRLRYCDLRSNCFQYGVPPIYVSGYVILRQIVNY